MHAQTKSRLKRHVHIILRYRRNERIGYYASCTQVIRLETWRNHVRSFNYKRDTKQRRSKRQIVIAEK